MKHLLLVAVASFCLSSPAIAQSTDGRIIHNFSYVGMSGRPLAASNWRREFERVYRSGGLDAALPLAMKEALDGNAGAMTVVGLAYARGEGVGRDATAAATWFRKAAAHGDAT